MTKNRNVILLMHRRINQGGLCSSPQNAPTLSHIITAVDQTLHTLLYFVLLFVLQPVEATDDAFWDQFWADTSTTVQDVFALVPAAEIRAVREESPSNLATLCYKV